MDAAVDPGKHRRLVAQHVIDTGKTDPLQRGIAAQRRIERRPCGMHGRDAAALRACGRRALCGGKIGGAGRRLQFGLGGDRRLRI